MSKEGILAKLIILVGFLALFGVACSDDTTTPGGGGSRTDDDDDNDDIWGDDDIGGGPSGRYCDLSLECPSGEQCDYVDGRSGKCVSSGTAQYPDPWWPDEDGGLPDSGKPDKGDDDDDTVEPDDDDDNGDDDDTVEPDDDDDVPDPCEGVVTECISDTVLRRCKHDGSGPEEVDCALSSYICHEGACKFCIPSEKYCIDAKTVGECMSDGSGVAPTPCPEMMRCDAEQVACVAAACEPNHKQCVDDKTLETCNAEGTAAENETCQGNTYCVTDERTGSSCQNLCDAAIASNSYFGCEFWPVNLSNTQLDAKFHDQYAVVVGNMHPTLDANVKVFKSGNVLVTEAVAKPRTTQVVYLPWNAQDVVASGKAKSTKAPNAYKLTSDIPVTVYQFNPLRSALPNPSGQGDYTYTNDASLLIPAHIFAPDYVGMSYPHMSSKMFMSSNDMPAYIAIVASAPGTTTVEVDFKGYTASGTGIQAYDPGQKGSFQLAQYEVLQLTTRAAGSTSVATGVCNGADCIYHPEADLTGSIIKANNPIAVYGGTDCSLVPYNQMACDHMEEQLFPFSRWGHTYIGTRSKPTGNGKGKDLWRIVGGVKGTSVTIDPQPEGIQTPFILNPGNRREFYSDGDFIIYTQSPDHPILVAQFLSGQNASSANVGDPAMILMAPVQQYRKDYLFLTPDTIAEDYANIVREQGTTVKLNGAVIPNQAFTRISSSKYEVARGVSLPDGQSHVEADNPVGLVVYGFDRYVSYGYLGGLDLKSITQVQPGG